MSGRIRVSNQWSDLEAAVVHELRSYRALVSDYKALQELMDMMCPQVTSQIKETSTHGVGTNSGESKMFATIEMREKMRKDLEDLNARLQGIMAMTKLLPADEHVVIVRRYMLGERMDDVADLTFISRAKCWAVHGRAIRRLAKVWTVLDGSGRI